MDLSSQEQAVVALVASGQLDEAADRLARLLPYAKDAAHHRLLTRLGAIRLRLGQLRTAVEVLQQATAQSDDGYAYLQLGNALRYLGNVAGATPALATALTRARSSGDGALAIAAFCAQGELALDQALSREAVERFGQALGLTELATDLRLSVAPLAGLAQAHLGWKNPRKGAGLARKALERAQLVNDRVGESRALLSLGLATGDLSVLTTARQVAAQAPHRPLEVKILRARLELAWDDALWREALAAAERFKMEAEHRALLALEPLSRTGVIA